MIDVDILKSRLNIIDVIGAVLPLKKSGKDHWTCCPFHGEKTPSFSVNEDKQFAYCFGCGWHGNAVNFHMEYNGFEFIEAAKDLAHGIGLDFGEEVKRDGVRPEIKKRHYWRLPDCHKEDPDTCESMIKKAQVENVKGIDFLRLRQSYMLPIYTPEAKLVNLKVFEGNQDYFVAGGPSYNGFTPIRKNDSNKWIAVISIKTAKQMVKVAPKTNIAVCWSDAVMNYICRWNYGDLHIVPAIFKDDDDALTEYVNKWFYFDGEKLTKGEQ